MVSSSGLNVILNVDAICAPLTGIGNYVLRLARLLPHSQHISRIRYFSSFRFVDDPEQALRLNENRATIRRISHLKVLARPVYRVARNMFLKRSLSKFRDHVFHSPNYLLPRWAGLCVATVHDLSYHRFPQFHPVERIALMGREMPKTLDRASHIITDSEFVKREIVETFGFPERKISSVYLGVDDEYRPRTVDETAPFLGRLGLGEARYLLVVATVEPRKNIERLIHAYSSLPADIQQHFPLVMCGAAGWSSRSIESAIARLERKGLVRHLGYVPEDVLPFVYAGAHAFAFPSLYEGFGLPVLEAMASGVPVLTSDCSALPEIAGEGALYANPEDVDDLRAKLEQVLTDEPHRQFLRRTGLARAKRFTWANCVTGTVDVYRALGNSNG